MLAAPEESVVRFSQNQSLSLQSFSNSKLFQGCQKVQYDAYAVKSTTSDCLYTVTVSSRPPKAGDIVKGKVIKCNFPDFKYNGASLLCKHGIYVMIRKVCH